VKNKRVTHRRAKRTEIEHIYDTERIKNEIKGIMHAQRDSTNKLSARQTTDVKQ
jgi:hypothetical protein